MHEMSRTLGMIPESMKEEGCFRSLQSVFKTKLALARSHLRATMEQSFIFHSKSVRIDSSEYDAKQLALYASRLDVENEFVEFLVQNSLTFVLNPLVESKSVVSISKRVSEWSFSTQNIRASDSESIGSVCGGIESFFAFINGLVDLSVVHQVGRRLWTQLVPLLSKRYGNRAELSSLESTMIEKNLIPSDTSRSLSTNWERDKAEKDRVSLTSTLAKVRNNLISDLNRATIHLNRIPSANVGTYVPLTVTEEAARIVNDSIKNQTTDSKVISKIISLFVVLRQPELSDPDAVNPRHAALFFNDCSYLGLALSLSGISVSSEILLLRTAAGTSVSWFLDKVRTRACSHLRASGGLLDTAQIADTEDSIYQCFAEINNCIKDWRSIAIPSDISNMWITTMIESVLKKTTNLSVEVARKAVGLSAKAGDMSIVTSGLWSVHKKFVEEIKSLGIPDSMLQQSVSWTITDRVRLALTASDTDLMRCEPLPDDENLYGISIDGFEAILQCNPILQRESKDVIRRLSSRLMVGPVKKGQERNFASLFD
jgi:hypothetical protein